MPVQTIGHILDKIRLLHWLNNVLFSTFKVFFAKKYSSRSTQGFDSQNPIRLYLGFIFNVQLTYRFYNQIAYQAKP